MKKLVILAAASAAAALPAAASAQEAPATQAAPAPATQVTDAEIAEFVGIVIQGRGLQNADMTDQEKQAEMLRIIGESDMGMTRFSAVSQAIGQDEALQARVQAEAVQQLGAAAAG